MKEEHEKISHSIEERPYSIEGRSYSITTKPATGLFLKHHNSDEAASTITVAQLYTLLVDTSTMERGSTLSLALSDSNNY